MRILFHFAVYQKIVHIMFSQWVGWMVELRMGVWDGTCWYLGDLGDRWKLIGWNVGLRMDEWDGSGVTLVYRERLSCKALSWGCAVLARSCRHGFPQGNWYMIQGLWYMVTYLLMIFMRRMGVIYKDLLGNLPHPHGCNLGQSCLFGKQRLSFRHKGREVPSWNFPFQLRVCGRPQRSWPSGCHPSRAPRQDCPSPPCFTRSWC